MLVTAGIASAKYFFQHASRKNTLTQARRNISRHYDLVNTETHIYISINMKSYLRIYCCIPLAFVCAEQRFLRFVLGRYDDILICGIQGQKGLKIAKL